MKNSYLKIFLILFCLICWQINFAVEYYVSTTGSDSNSGTIDAPFATIQKGVDAATAGDIIYVRGGTYKPAKRILINKAGTADARISLFGYPGETVIIDGSTMSPANTSEFKMSRCIYVNHLGNYWHFKNLEMCKALDNGMKVEGSYNIIENCKFHDNNDTGLQIGMYKDFDYEETKSFPISGSPQFNPNYTYCRYNVVINCDAWYNYDSKAYSGSDDGGDADGFAAKLFPGPGTEFHGCRGWMNSDDNWDLYMVYHPILIENCWSWRAGRKPDNSEGVNGNGFKLGGGGSSGGAAFNQSVGAHVVRNNIAFECLHKGFDQNNAQEAMYLLNNVSFSNEFNYRFSQPFDYGDMYLRNNVGFKPTKNNKSNHEFNSSSNPNSDYNSWTTLDGCNPIKDAASKSALTKDYTGEFLSLSSSDFLASRQADGSLPDNNFGKIKEESVFIDTGQIIDNFTPAAFLPVAKQPLDYQVLANVTIPYSGTTADFGAFEVGDPTQATLTLVSGNPNQTVYLGTAITPIVYKWGAAATDVTVENLPGGISVSKDANAKTATISGNPTATGTYAIKSAGGVNEIVLNGTITVSTVAPGTLICTSNNLSQTVNIGSAIQNIVIEWGGGATDVVVSNLPAGLQSSQAGNILTISGTPVADGTFTVKTVGGMSELTLSGTITRVIPTKVLTGDWYPITVSYEERHADLQGDVVVLSSDANTKWSPGYTENDGGTPFGHAGAIEVGRSGGYVQFTLPSLVELKVNMHTTGGRTVQILYGTPGTDASTWTSYSTGSFSKGTFPAWDVMSKAGIAETRNPIAIRFINTVSGGEIRLYDLFIRIYDDIITDIRDIKETASCKAYQTETAFVVHGDIASLKVLNLSGQLLSHSTLSQTVNIAGLNKGIYLLQIVDKQGRHETLKVIKK
ncbi:MAG: T9SS type A sorting domain-containing protein [Dysgonamonadaceae bacterium]|jgi:hypothetical protein|nr:T9SS type A sorting domain-containing protein [Dysgonamonadaceae bacterium]